MWRHGDVMIAATVEIPNDAQRCPSLILARGETTGHSHRVEDPATAELWMHRNMMYLKVVADTAALIHEEHKRITLPRGTYRVWQQREYTPGAIRRVAD